MPLHEFSRHLLTTQRMTGNEQSFLDDRVPYRYRSRDDTQLHTARTGETLYTLAAKFYDGVVRPAGLWWVIADFQPQPIHDPTIVLKDGVVIYIPSLRVVVEDILSENRRRESVTTTIGQRGLT